MGKGDIRSKKGKIVAGSFGKSRMRKSNIKTVIAEAAVAEKPKKAVKKKTVKAKKK